MTFNHPNPYLYTLFFKYYAHRKQYDTKSWFAWFMLDAGRPIRFSRTIPRNTVGQTRSTELDVRKKNIFLRVGCTEQQHQGCFSRTGHPRRTAPRRRRTPAPCYAIARENSSEMSSQSNSKKPSSQNQTTSSQKKPVLFTPDGKLVERAPLGAVVTDAVRRWYAETEKEAQRGDVKAMALLGQMLMEGYGCEVDMERGKQLAEKARRRGYRMHRVYCEI